jgi:hypothetical protein
MGGNMNDRVAFVTDGSRGTVHACSIASARMLDMVDLQKLPSKLAGVANSAICAAATEWPLRLALERNLFCFDKAENSLAFDGASLATSDAPSVDGHKPMLLDKLRRQGEPTANQETNQQR